jgi:hypothetical protein
MLKALRARLFGRRCTKHDLWFQSDFCPQCVRAMVVRQETHDLVAMEFPRPAVARTVAA